MFNDAIDEYNLNPAKPVIFNYPFKKIKIEHEPTAHRNLTVQTIRQIRDMQPASRLMTIAIDIFMLQFYLLGINIKDLFYLKPQNIIDGRLQFNRSKTGRKYNIKLEPEALEIIKKYKGKNYLLRFADYCAHERSGEQKAHTRKTVLQYKDSGTFLKMMNKQLKEVQKILGINAVRPLTSYFSRHSFATIMREIGISNDDISLCLGHRQPEQNLKISGIYINEDYKRADIATRKLIDCLHTLI
jgi:integrase